METFTSSSAGARPFWRACVRLGGLTVEVQKVMDLVALEPPLSVWMGDRLVGWCQATGGLEVYDR